MGIVLVTCPAVIRLAPYLSIYQRIYINTKLTLIAHNKLFYTLWLFFSVKLFLYFLVTMNFYIQLSDFKIILLRKIILKSVFERYN